MSINFLCRITLWNVIEYSGRSGGGCVSSIMVGSFSVSELECCRCTSDTWLVCDAVKQVSVSIWIAWRSGLLIEVVVQCYFHWCVFKMFEIQGLGSTEKAPIQRTIAVLDMEPRASYIKTNWFTRFRSAKCWCSVVHLPSPAVRWESFTVEHWAVLVEGSALNAGCVRLKNMRLQSSQRA